MLLAKVGMLNVMCQFQYRRVCFFSSVMSSDGETEKNESKSVYPILSAATLWLCQNHYKGGEMDQVLDRV